jgi:hypothetical protein
MWTVHEALQFREVVPSSYLQTVFKTSLSLNSDRTGSSDNPDAKRLYEHLGYVDWGQGEFLISWEADESNGQTRTDAEIVTYMHKPF